MVTEEKPEETQPTKPARNRRRSPEPADESPPQNSSTPDENPPAAEPESTTHHLTSQTCVFCSAAVGVDPDNLDGARFITEPGLSIKHYVCSGCNDAETRT